MFMRSGRILVRVTTAGLFFSALFASSDDQKREVKFRCPGELVFKIVFSGPEAETADLTLWNHEQHKLKRALSGSGARYTNEKENVIFWNKGNEATLTLADATHAGRVVISPKPRR
jgi:membrane-bound inhibitor of C-type lysozyme